MGAGDVLLAIKIAGEESSISIWEGGGLGGGQWLGDARERWFLVFWRDWDCGVLEADRLPVLGGE